MEGLQFVGTRLAAQLRQACHTGVPVTDAPTAICLCRLVEAYTLTKMDEFDNSRSGSSPIGRGVATRAAIYVSGMALAL